MNKPALHIVKPLPDFLKAPKATCYLDGEDQRFVLVEGDKVPLWAYIEGEENEAYQEGHQAGYGLATYHWGCILVVLATVTLSVYLTTFFYHIHLFNLIPLDGL